MMNPMVIPTIAPLAVDPTNETAKTDKTRRASMPVITAIMPYAAIRPRHQDRERDRRQAAFEAWLGLRNGATCLIGANTGMSRRLNVISQRYTHEDDDEGLVLDVEV
ncbi:MAG: hypothetical protein ACTHY5_06265 [Oceanisphaera sp.]|uniref:hypothetical protein n=1 Tax=Oceanisphaera sp. TaxID=1929979 RepID=UPI003F9B838E